MKHTATPKLNESHATRSIAWLALLCTLILLSRDLITPAQAGDRSSGRFYMTGQMWTRNLVRGPQGQPIFAEFASDGTPIKEIGEAINEPLEHATVLSANDYRLEVARYDDLKARFGGTDAKGHAILNRDAYSATSFKTLREGYTINKPPLQPLSRSVVVRGPLTLLTVGTNPVLLESTINLNSIDREVVSNTQLKSLLIDAKGNVLYKTANNYGYRVSDIKQKSGESDPLCRPAYGIEKDRDGYSPTQDALCGPVLGAHVETQIFPGQYGGALTGNQGRWAMFYFKSPCPGFNYRYTTDFYQTLFYTNFNPKGSALGQYFQRDEWADWCMGLSEALSGSTSVSGLMTGIAMSAIENSTAEAPRHMVNYVDVAAITGLAKFGNGLNPLDAIPGDSDATQYQTNLPTFTPSRAADLGLSFDFDGDGIPDPMDPAPVDYNKDNRAEEIGFYLNGKQPGDKDAQGNPIPPDLIRRLDTLPDFQHQGLLKQISQQDMKETDLYIYRLSNGQKIQERKGLNDINIYKDGTSNVSYLSLLRGPRALSQFFGLNFSDWQSATGINPELHVKQADHLRVGEPLKIILVNRRTGYIGTALTQMPAATSGSIDFPIQPIVMRPPNLKIRAERYSSIEAGLEAGDTKKHLIGFEGAGIKSDNVIAVISDWFDHDGTPLPGDLSGYTGRIAKITQDKEVGSSIAQFGITPGAHLQLVQLAGDAQLGNDHYYIHVNGEPEDGSPNFTTLGSDANDEILKKRPKHYVPVLVPIYDEAETIRRKNLWYYATYIDRQTGLPAPEPVYHWVYRPEMQFSVVELDLNKNSGINQTMTYLDGSLKTEQCQEGPPEQIQKCIEGLKFNYWLDQNKLSPLDLFGPAIPENDKTTYGNKSELIFSLGAEEVIATVNQNGTAIFIDADHLNSLMQEDYIVLSLYQNTDAANTLWELALPKVYLSVDANRDGRITPDLPAVRRVLNYQAAGDAALLKRKLIDNNIDVVTAEQPYVFWLNDDYDVVLDNDLVDPDAIQCTSNVHDKCEQVDLNNLRSGEAGHRNDKNSDTNHRDKIESLADLEDFAPLEVRVSPYNPNVKLKIKLRAVGMGVDVFPGYWESQKATEYLFDKALAEKHASINHGSKDPNYPGVIEDTLTLDNDTAQTKLWEIPAISFKAENGDLVARFIFEGVSSRWRELCDPHPDKCYLEAIISTIIPNSDGSPGKEVQVAAERLQMVLHPMENLYDHFTVGDNDKGWLDDNFVLKSPNPKPQHNQFVPIIDRPAPDNSKPRPEYILSVHGWRMQTWERRRFSETAYKRLYWQGYKGYFGLASWPTEWFEVNGNPITDVIRAALDSQNYDRSEAVARRAGPYLLDLFANLNAIGDLHVFAHSMGNVVVGEALRRGAEEQRGKLVSTYVALQAAEAAHAYDPALQNRDGYAYWPGLNPFCCRYENVGSTVVLGETSAYRNTEVSNRYKYGFVPFGFQDTLDETKGTIPPPYHTQNHAIVGKMYNFFNTDDHALDAYDTNQAMKPDVGTGYVKEIQGTINSSAPDSEIALWQVKDRYYYSLAVSQPGNTNTEYLQNDGTLSDPTPAFDKNGKTEIHWSVWGNKKQSPTALGQPGRPEILAHIIPVRSRALGATDVPVGGAAVFDGRLNLKNSLPVYAKLDGQGFQHSAQFLAYNAERWPIWWNVLDAFSISKNRKPPE